MKLDLDNAQASDYDSLDAHSMDTMVMDGIQDQQFTEWSNDRWPSQWGYFNQVPELKNAILLKSIWVCGKGYEVGDSKTKAILNNVDGCGKDTFRLLLYNQDVIRRVGGDSYAEVIRDPESGEFRNLKPLDPGTMKNVFDRSGRVVRYEQLTPYPTKGFLNQIKGNAIKNWMGMRKVSATFEPHEIFHLMNNRLGSQTHGISDIDSIEDTILADDKSFKDMEKIVRFQAKPFIIFKLKTDKTDKITAFAEKIRSMRNLGEDMFIPDDENLLSWDVVQVNPSNILMAWRDDLRNRFYRAIGLPQVVPGGGGQSTESESRVIYIAFEQIVMSEQLYLEEQIWNQLGLKVNLIHPTLIEDLIGATMDKNADTTINTQSSELNPAASPQ